MVAGGGGSVVVVVVVVVVVLDMEMMVWYRDTVRSEGAPKLIEEEEEINMYYLD